MRFSCGSCGERYLDEHIDTCECGHTLCMNCMGAHTRTNGHTSASQQGRHRVQLNAHFNRDITRKIDEIMLAHPRVIACSTLAAPQVVQTDIKLLKDSDTLRRHRYTLERPRYEHLSVAMNQNFDDILGWYLEALHRFVDKLDPPDSTILAPSS